MIIYNIPYTYNHLRVTFKDSKLGKAVSEQLLRSSLKNRVIKFVEEMEQIAKINITA